MWPTLAFLGAIALLATPVCVIYLFIEVRALKQKVQSLDASNDRPATKPGVEAPVTKAPAQEADPPAPTSVPTQTIKAITPPRQRRPSGQKSPSLDDRLAGFTETLRAANWLILAGGIVLAFGVGFLIKYSIEEGLLGPLARVLIGGALGLGLIVFGEMARHRSFGRVAAVIREDALPPTLTSAGLLALFTSCYGAYALYDLLPPLIAFALLAAIAFGAIALSLIHGPLIGSLGLAGAYAVPLLVSNNDTSALALFSYLAAVTLSAIYISRLRSWLWLSVVALVGSAGWLTYATGLFYIDPPTRPVLYGFAILMAMAFGTLLASQSERKKTSIWPPMRPSFLGPAIFALLLWIFFSTKQPDPLALIRSASSPWGLW